MVPQQLIAEAMGIGTSARLRVFARYKTQAKRRGLDFALTFDQFEDLVASACHYCGLPPGNVCRIEDSGIEYTVRYQGIDRADNEHGYWPDNVVACCPSCNSSKGRGAAPR